MPCWAGQGLALRTTLAYTCSFWLIRTVWMLIKGASDVGAIIWLRRYHTYDEKVTLFSLLLFT
jgi:hypothetical protein